MLSLLPCVEVGPRGQAEGAVVWLHGLGANGHDFEPIVPYLELPRVRFVFPHAPLRRVTVNGGMEMPAWYDIATLGQEGGENAAHVRDARSQVDALLRREKERGIAPERTVLAGFSQGAAVALYAGTRYPETLAGILVLSGYEVLPRTREAEPSPANRRTPMLFCHGTLDPLVPVARGRAAFEAHAGPERDAQWREFPIAHEVSDEEIAAVRDWLHARLM
jgi:phospholipase/carboxylesterase